MYDQNLEIDRCRCEPTEATLATTTLGMNGHTRLAELRRLAALGRAELPFLQLQALAGYDPEQLRTAKYVGAYIHFITRPEVTGILEQWAADSERAHDLLKLSVLLGGSADLIQALRPFDESKAAVQALYGTIGDDPLTALVSEQRAVVQDSALAHWLQQLRVLILLRGLELLAVGARSDRHLTVVSNETRKACEKDASNQLGWMRMVSSPSRELPDFEADLIFRCEMCAPRRRAPGQAPMLGAGLQIFRTLRRIARGGAWWDPKSLQDNPKLASFFGVGNSFSFGGELSGPALLNPLEADGGTADNIVQATAAGPDARCTNQKVKLGTTQAQIRKHGTQILLEGAEQHLYLASSWHQLSDGERAAMAQRIQDLLKGESPVDQMGAALTLTAWVTARGMFDVETIQLGSELKVDWVLNTVTGVLCRQPPRFGRGIQATSLPEAAQKWLQPLVDRIELKLCSAARQALNCHAQGHAEATTIQELWNAVSPHVPLDKWFSEVLAGTTELRRLTGPAMATALASSVFGQTTDGTFAQLLASQRRTALPAASAYGAYQLAQVQLTQQGALPRALVAAPLPTREPGTANAAGSELDFDLSEVANAIGDLIARYEIAASDPTCWIEAHNLLTSVVVIAMLASTGARPVNSPFESRAWFDFASLLVYVEDKRSGPTTGARICVLSSIAKQLLEELYLPHLESLASLLEPQCPVFAQAIRATGVEAPDQNRPLPLLFYLRAAPDFAWVEVTETQLGVQCGHAWPAPWNMFRHVLATQLVRRRVHPEIVDALMAHGDRGAESHGDHSLRIPRDDIELARPQVEELQHELILRPPALRPTLPTRLHGRYSDLNLDNSPQWGRQARAEARDQSHAAARLRAVQDIERLVDGRVPGALTSEEWQTIGNTMLFRGTLPHPAASLRYEAFEDWLADAWHKKRALVAVRKRYCPLPPPQSLFTSEFIGAQRALDEATQEFHRAMTSVDLHGERAPGPMMAAVLGAIELVLTSKVCHVPTLLDLAHLRRNVRLVRFEGRFWFERANANLWQDGRPVMRVQLSDRAARWIGIGLSSTRREVKEALVPPFLQPWIATHLAGSSTLQAAFGRLCTVRKQINAWNCTGVEAAHLSSRRVVTALPHHDWYRLVRLHAPLLSEPSAENEEYATDDANFEVPVGRTLSPPPRNDTAQRCATLLDGITKAFETKPHASAVLAEVRRLTADSGFLKGDAPQVLAHFACVLLTRKRRTGKKVRLRLQTARRYWYSLVEPFVDLGHDRFLPDEDEESIREFYEDVVHWWEKNPEREPADGTARTSSDTDTVTAEELAAAQHHDAMRRTVAQLKDFHDFAVEAYGLEDVDWSGVDLGSRVAVGRPSLILLSEFEAALQALLGEQTPETLIDDRLSAAFVLVASGRFGLRVSEAVGMYREDWLDWSGAVVMLVRSNAIRNLKSSHSRRQVPLVEQLTDIEQRIVREALRRWELAHKAGVSAPLLSGVTKDTYWSIKATISDLLLNVLKAATGSSAARIHGLRHSFACRLLALLIGHTPGKGIAVSAVASQHARRLLLGRDQLDRRAMWAIARGLGHASPSTAIACYVHGIELWAKPIGDMAHWNGEGVATGSFVDLDKLLPDSAYPRQAKLSHTESTPAASLPLRRIRFLSLTQAGYKEDRARVTSGLSISESVKLQEILSALPDEAVMETESLPAANVLGSISYRRWQALTQIVAQAKTDVINIQDSSDALGVPIGPRRHLILHRQHHFKAAADFITQLRLGTEDVRLAQTSVLHPVKQQWVTDVQLGDYLVAGRDLGKDFRLDTVAWGDPPEPVQHRAALIPSNSPKCRIASTQELLVLWAVTYESRPAS